MLGDIRKDSTKDSEQSREEFKGRNTKKEWLQREKHSENDSPLLEHGTQKGK